MAGERNLLKGLRTTRERSRRNNLGGNMDMTATGTADINSSRNKATEVIETGSGSTSIAAVQGVSWKKPRTVTEAGPSQGAPSEAARSVTVTMNPSLLECCACFGPLVPPLFQCDIGHITSSECRNAVVFKCSKCPPEANAVTRCHAMERVLGGLKVPCSFHVNGCTKVMPYEERAEHENSCPCAISFCPVPGCRVGRYAGMSMFEHLSAEHEEMTRTCVPFDTVRALQMHKGQTAHAVFLDGGNHEEVYQSVFLLVAEVMLLPAPARAISVFRIVNNNGPMQEHEYKFKIQVYAKTGVLTLSGQTENVRSLIKPYAAKAALIVPAAMWSPENSPVYIEIK